MKVFVIDVDGCLTDGSFMYTAQGKVMKSFGPDDADALHWLQEAKPDLEIWCITGDARGYDISSRRVHDMDLPIALVASKADARIEWLKTRWPLDEIIYMGDGFHDADVMRAVAYGIAPAGCDADTMSEADHVCMYFGGDRAVAEACKHIAKALS